MTQRKRQPPSEQTAASDDPAMEFLQAEVERLRQAVAALQVQSSGHIRRFGELQLEVDTLKKSASVLVPRRAAG